MKKAILSLLALVVATAGLLQITAVQAFLVGLIFPSFPDYPEPIAQLDENSTGTIYYQSATPFDLDVLLNNMEDARPTTGMGHLYIPDIATSDQPVPAMVILHGSGGISPGREHEYAKLLNENGIAAVVVDYYQPRGVTEDTNYMMKVNAVTEFDVITDAYSVYKLLQSSPLVDGSKIGVMGFSYGGMASRLAMDERFHNILAPGTDGFSLYVDVYGPCFQNLGTQATNGKPLLTLRGTEDFSNELKACAAREKELRALNVDVNSIIYQGAGHSWENLAPQALKEDAPYIAGCEVTYDPKGFPLINGEHILKLSDQPTREERIASRLKSGPKYKDCLKYGYLIGNDDETKQQAYSDLLSFLKKNFDRSMTLVANES
ncbi:dienelactone hydrolase family protein [Endozoicomonas elysicola]|uniref:Dienelactone hydrolase domain-containing protein n=1 Tax=Endozoicomonas elysicola TaxID=305900 RepID=A0A081KBS9_9GAMM|nr:dienelactone hydrolase family protein [Endozoicomonas elysicola]KEI71605.1 hypothetical protein GV64_13420 [Endozoicomonas elysicola]